MPLMKHLKYKGCILFYSGTFNSYFEIANHAGRLRESLETRFGSHPIDHLD